MNGASLYDLYELESRVSAQGEVRMSEEATESAGTETGQVDEGTGAGTDPEAEGTGTGEPELTPEEMASALKDWKSRARQWETRSKGNAEAAKELAELKKSQMTEAQRVQVERDEAIRERDEARADHSRVMAAAAHDLPIEMIDDLGTGTDEEISERAERWAGLIETRAQEIAQVLVKDMIDNPQQGRNGSLLGARPVESMRAGSAPSNGAPSSDPNAWFRNLVQGRNE